MKALTISIWATLFLTFAYSNIDKNSTKKETKKDISASAIEGRELYLEAKCQKCHLQDDKFDPNSIKKKGLLSKIKDKKGIHKWVVDCDSFFNVGWFPEEADKVTNYLNEYHYKFKK